MSQSSSCLPAVLPSEFQLCSHDRFLVLLVINKFCFQAPFVSLYLNPNLHQPSSTAGVATFTHQDTRLPDMLETLV